MFSVVKNGENRLDIALSGKFDKAAVIAGQNWVRVGSQIEGSLIPGLEIKAFELDKESEAEAWLSK